MREIIYHFVHRGVYQTEDNTVFGGDAQLKVIVKPHDYSLAISGEVLRSSSCPGCTALVSGDGAVVFSDPEGSEIARVEKGEGTYPGFRMEWKQDLISICFGSLVEVDNYPNCDGESDRWSTVWRTRRAVTLNLKDNTIAVK